ncbi:MAG: hypothetical protein PWR03_587 [Tenuifilum sp.]|uniref:thioredoxin family protein n=1 Tax=Tenuifilum sp. TaxID=2760880 RepID=UPI0024AC3C9E|nr:DUF255 domain-containing protein [Tenuifilum sp.]MDI3526404.1 hypothetical protein [Tenuifilum sp.]
MRSTAKILILLIGAIFSESLFAQNSESVKWIGIEEAMTLNKTQPRKIFIDVYTDWCGWCKKMDANTFTNPVIADYLSNKFHAVKLNAEGRKDIVYKGKTYKNKGQNTRSPHEFAIAILQGRLSYPSIVFMDENNNPITVVPGYLRPEQLEPILEFIVSDAYKTQKWEDFRAKFVSKLGTAKK